MIINLFENISIFELLPINTIIGLYLYNKFKYKLPVWIKSLDMLTSEEILICALTECIKNPTKESEILFYYKMKKNYIEINEETFLSEYQKVGCGGDGERILSIFDRIPNRQQWSYGSGGRYIRLNIRDFRTKTENCILELIFEINGYNTFSYRFFIKGYGDLFIPLFYGATKLNSLVS